MTNAKEFRFLGQTLPKLTIGYGLMLVAWGALFSIGSESITSWIPSMIGAPILLSGLIAQLRPGARKAVMHIAVLFGLLAFLGGFRFFAALGSEGGLFGKPTAALSQLMLLVTGGFYTFGCIQSFRAARASRESE